MACGSGSAVGRFEEEKITGGTLDVSEAGLVIVVHELPAGVGDEGQLGYRYRVSANLTARAFVGKNPDSTTDFQKARR